MSLPLWGTEYGDDEIRTELRRYNDCNVVSFRSSDELVHETVRLIAEGKVLAWFQGRMEFGPRALGNRSILGNPLLPEMRDKVNALVKKRESFRPFAPAVTEESASVYFHIAEDDVAAYRHMLIVTQVRSSYRTLLPAITHVNGSARVQTVARQDSTLFWQLLTEFGRQVGHPVLLNTSFNVRGQPIVRTPREALDTFLEANLDGLVIGNHLVTRAEVNERSMLR
jgi:carbamoyltransferase